ncbi:ribosome small subunit-dependent GTPase A [Parasporobacterium paucivorans]|uniref:Small ribosomal subunit biogenesis GTPase RsgA n=1 Tax=Parasporobacterium paucivorans DSM 15970 TaxID=1122934 RepID=A0A1M6ERM0_9FIRM|nr:ribosome small subunit-dependent GTPase A [Parasporobacterium paucivorans]SHI88055.1 ribosome biogenesis GTPase [Parasporobacterium paucivorans DSM 15970]
MQGKIIKGIAGFYYVHVEGFGIYECKAKGIFRNRGIKPLVGDDVEMDVLDEEKKLGNIADILERHNVLVRPAVANVDQAVVVFAIKEPEPNLNLLDRFIISMKQQGVPVVICFNKVDRSTETDCRRLQEIYEKSGCRILFTSVKEQSGMDSIENAVRGKTTVFAGPSGVGKSSLLNVLMPEAHSKTGIISEKIKRGKHTTRHSEIFNLENNTYIMDTPGFSSMSVLDCEKEELKDYYEEFLYYAGECRFKGCIHINEPGCAVKEALENNEIPRERYDNYIHLYNELKEIRKY